jgi:hypothetical protein
VDTYKPDDVIGTKAWIKEGISNAEVFRADFTTCRSDRSARGGGVFIYAKNFIASTESWVDENCEMIAVEMKGMEVVSRPLGHPPPPTIRDVTRKQT